MNMVYRLLKNIIDLCLDPEMPLLRIFSQNTKTLILKAFICTLMFIEVRSENKCPVDKEDNGQEKWTF